MGAKSRDMAANRLPLPEAISLLLEDIVAAKQQRPRPDVALMDRLQALDLFEMMIRVDDLSEQGGLSGGNPELDRWAELDPASFGRKLSAEPGGIILATLLLLSPRALGALAPQLSFMRWMEVTRALNHVTPEQLRGLRGDYRLEQYLTGAAGRPHLNFPWVFPLPLPSVLRVVQSTKFRLGLMNPEGQAEARRRHARFFQFGYP